MNNIERLKALMSINAEMDTLQLEERFKQIAHMLFNDLAIQTVKGLYLFKEIEFYVYNKQHRDIITHPRSSKALCWYINDFGGIDLNFDSRIDLEKVKSQKRYLLNDDSYFGGILIRQLVSEDGSETLDGPWACAELFRCFDALGINNVLPVLISHKSTMTGYIQKERIRLIANKKEIRDKVDNILLSYERHPNKDLLYEDFALFKEKPYRFIRCDALMHDYDTNEVYFSKWLGDEKEGHPKFYQQLLQILGKAGINAKELKSTSDYWARDYMPIQLGVDDFLKYRYYPDYLVNSKNPEDKYTITNCARVLQGLDIKCRSTALIIDGGNMVPCGPYIVMTDKVFTENDFSKNDISFKSKLEKELGHPVIIIPWTLHEEAGNDNVDKYGHSDGFIKWCGGNRILMGNHAEFYPNEAEEIKRTLEAYGFVVTEIRFNDKVANPTKQYNWAYINFLQVGKTIVMPKFNIDEDDIAKDYIKTSFPDCDIYQIEMEDIVKEGGALHCISWNIRRNLV